MVVKFATLCDKCKKRSEEYTSFPSCKDCQGDFCPDCDIKSERSGDERNLTLCHGCRLVRLMFEGEYEDIR